MYTKIEHGFANGYTAGEPVEVHFQLARAPMRRYHQVLKSALCV